MLEGEIAQFLSTTGLSITLAVYIAFRAGRRVRGLTSRNMEEKLGDFLFDELKALICTKLEELFEAQGIQLPVGLTIQDVAVNLHLEVEDVLLLQDIINSLNEQGPLSQYYTQAFAAVFQFIAGGG